MPSDLRRKVKNSRDLQGAGSQGWVPGTNLYTPTEYEGLFLLSGVLRPVKEGVGRDGTRGQGGNAVRTGSAPAK